MYPYPLFPNVKLLSNVNLYGIMIAIGILACIGVLYYYGKLKKNDTRFTDYVFYIAVVSIGFGFFMAAVFQGFFKFIKNPEEGFSINNGITFLGGLIGGASAFLILFFAFRKHAHGDFTQIVTIAPCCIVIAHAFGRIGCFFAGCCYGCVTHGPLGVKFPDLKDLVYPTQLYESLFLFILFGVLSYLLIKKDYKYTLSLYMLAYGVFRFFIEFLRGDYYERAVNGPLSPSQYISLILIVGSVGVYFLLKYLFKRYDEKVKNQ